MGVAINNESTTKPPYLKNNQIMPRASPNMPFNNVQGFEVMSPDLQTLATGIVN